MTLLGRDFVEVDALVTDRYLDSLLAGADEPMAGPAAAAHGWGTLAGLFAGGRQADSDQLDRGVRLASERLTRDLPRFHPSFRFEERLAVRLAEAAAAMRMPVAAGGEHETALIPFPMPDPYDPSEGSDRGPGDAWADALSRPLLVGGAVVASALSLAGAAWVAWHRSRVRVNPMARATRAAHANRAAHAMRSRPV